ncbi:hypothetical protein ACFPC0_10075 [Streptomyces andamanensis]|uniref:Uncharacterized protein n=1 Tax=Streptomyces andamanensis TaxID=1565035 RepID=A0ABV8TC19_9ACTN|nr:hypothetical protein [Streptomyces sp. SAT1]ANH93232.1 hypothetical protein A8713_20405 [Streptomyces sp. SAT1]
MPFDDDEPVFRRSKFGTNRYEYNPDNPVGMALIVLSLLVAGVVLLLMHEHAGPFARPADRDTYTPAPAVPSAPPADSWQP